MSSSKNNKNEDNDNDNDNAFMDHVHQYSLYKIQLETLRSKSQTPDKLKTTDTYHWFRIDERNEWIDTLGSPSCHNEVEEVSVEWKLIHKIYIMIY